MNFRGVEIPDHGILVVPQSLCGDGEAQRYLMDALLVSAEENGVRPPIVVALADGQTIESLPLEELRAIIEAADKS